MLDCCYLHLDNVAFEISELIELLALCLSAVTITSL